MTLKLNRIKLVNIRNHSEFEFTPNAEGITALHGPNGAGKSSIVDSIAWTLYGTRPGGVSRNWRNVYIVKNDVNLKTEEAYAELEIEVDGNPILIKREVMNGGAMNCSAWEQENGIWSSEPVAGPAVSHFNAWIKKRLRMDEEGFLAAVLVQQKQVDQLISTGPKERGAVIEKLTGITGLSIALEQAKKEYSTLKKSLSDSSFDSDRLENLKIELEQIEKNLDEKKSKQSAITGTIVEKREDVENLTKKVNTANESLRQFNLCEQKIEQLTIKIFQAKKDIARLTKAKDAKKKMLSLIGSFDGLKELESNVKVQRNTFRKLDTDQNRISEKVSELEEQITAYKEFIEANLDNAEAKEILAVKIEHLTEKIDTAKTNGEFCKNKIVELKKVLKTAKSGSGKCPTCLQAINETYTKHIEAEITLNENNIVTHREKYTSLVKDKNDVEKQLDISNKIASAKEFIDAAESKIIELKKNKAKIVAQLLTIESELSSKEKVLTEMQHGQNVRREYEELLQESIDVSELIENYNSEISLYKEKIKEINKVSAESVEKIQDKLETKRESLKTSEISLADLKGDINLLKEKIINISDKIEADEKTLASYKEVLAAIEKVGYTVDLVEEFRANRIATSIPIIESYASDYLNSFTEGKITQLRLDTKFNAYVILADGSQREINLLSGGELSAAAIALRLAISNLLNDSVSSNLIVLDEVLVAMDTVRAESILQSIKTANKNQGQIIMIAHSDEINGIADKIVTLGSK